MTGPGKQIECWDKNVITKIRVSVSTSNSKCLRMKGRYEDIAQDATQRKDGNYGI